MSHVVKSHKPYNNNMTKTVSDKLKKIFSKFQSQSVSKGTIILTPNQSTNNTNFLKSGIVRMYSIHDNGDEATMLLFKANSFFSYSSLIV